MNRWISGALALVVLAWASVSWAVGGDGDGDGEAPDSVRIAVDAETRLEIELMSGSIEIRGWDEPAIRVRARGADVSGLDIESKAGRVTVRGTRPGIGWLRIPILGPGVDVEIDVPRKAEIRASTVTGTITAEDVEGRLSLHAANGKIEVQGAPEEAQLETMNADIEFEGRDSRVDARTVNGRIELSGVADEVVANTINGSIEVEGGVIERADLRALAGSIELVATLAPGARINCKTYSGSVSLEVPEKTSARFDVQSFSGRVENELDSSSVTSWRGGPGQRLDFTAGEGDGRVTIESFSGRVEIRTRD
ncbi:MAG: DUF4097 domain-containing protein [bacterium]|nr:DUF4097 domain-containing protein [bacterium]